MSVESKLNVQNVFRMKTNLRRFLFTLSLTALVCGLMMHIVARSAIEKYESRQAAVLQKAMQQPGKNIEQNDVLKQSQLASIRTESFCGSMFIGLGIVLSLLWIWLGGRTGLWILLVLLLFDVPFWMF